MRRALTGQSATVVAVSPTRSWSGTTSSSCVLLESCWLLRMGDDQLRREWRRAAAAEPKELRRERGSPVSSWAALSSMGSVGSGVGSGAATSLRLPKPNELRRRGAGAGAGASLVSIGAGAGEG